MWWYGVVCKAAVMSSCMSAGCSLAGCRDMVPCLAITAIYILPWRTRGKKRKEKEKKIEDVGEMIANKKHLSLKDLPPSKGSTLDPHHKTNARVCSSVFHEHISGLSRAGAGGMVVGRPWQQSLFYMDLHHAPSRSFTSSSSFPNGNGRPG